MIWDGAVTKAAACTQGLETFAWLSVEDNAAEGLCVTRCVFPGAPNPQGMSGNLGCWHRAGEHSPS